MDNANLYASAGALLGTLITDHCGVAALLRTHSDDSKLKIRHIHRRSLLRYFHPPSDRP